MDTRGAQRRGWRQRIGAKTADVVAIGLTALVVAGCALAPNPTPRASATATADGRTGVVYTERGADGEPVDVLIVFDADGRLMGTRSIEVAETGR